MNPYHPALLPRGGRVSRYRWSSHVLPIPICGQARYGSRLRNALQRTIFQDAAERRAESVAQPPTDLAIGHAGGDRALPRLVSRAALVILQPVAAAMCLH